MQELVRLSLIVIALACLGLVVWGLHQSLRRLAAEASSHRKILTGFVLAMVAWLTFTALAARTGALAEWNVFPPRLPFIPLSALIAVLVLSRSRIVNALAAVTPRHWPVAMQTFRIGVELVFWGLFVTGGAPAQVTFEGRNFDVLVGSSAPLIAFLIWRMNLRPRLVVIWNLAGLGILANTIFTVLTSTPGPIFLNWPRPFTAIATWPFIWIAAFLAPLAIFLHVFSIKQNLLDKAAG